MALSEFTFQYVSQKSVKGQALADFLVHHPSTEFEGAEEVDIEIIYVASMTNNHWTMYFDGSSTEFSAGAGVVVETPEGQKFQFAFQLDFTCTNNQAEYEALIVGLEILQEMGARRVLVFGDSQLVVNQMNKEFKCTSWGLLSYHALADQLANTFDRISFAHLPRGQNMEANEMAQLASGLRIPEGDDSRVIKIAKRTLPTLEERGVSEDAFVIDIEPDDWRLPIIKFHKNPQGNHDRKTRYLAGQFVIYKEAVYRKSSDDLLLLCIGGQETL
ncbi:uncharacterized protein LOC133737473 [Rosa rugosa]|uniref:uncharacterized protein LOC133737473 n=1 Tax=Rosa rugosa TaxID=74645 RepID=UPI002B40A8D6|nr:uncharacterized protein LOC133737473 [Rosa rugosa]